MNHPPVNLDNEARLRHELYQLLSGRNAHLTFEDATADFPPQHINTFPTNVPYTFWHLVEHLRLAQEDILDFMINPDYEARAWPDDYWPDPAAKTTAQGWQESVAAFLEDRARMAAMIEDPGIDLLAELPHAPGYTILREIVLTADHNAYHVGELAILRQVMQAWPGEDAGVL